MKKTLMGILIGSALIGTSCKKYLDINKNPNQATSATPELILPQALAYTANVVNSYSNYGSQTGIYAANAGGYGGFGESITYNYTTTGSFLFNTTYDNLEDYQAIENYAAGVPEYSYFKAAAKIMKAYEFQLLVDAFNDVPYADALKGTENLTPTYSKGADIYKDLAIQLDSAIAAIDFGNSTSGTKGLGTSDVLFGGDMDAWKKFANTIKLRLIIRGADKVAFTNTSFSDDGFLDQDALVNPGYTRDNGRQNPAWNNWAYTYVGGAGNKAWMPSTFIFGFYDGTTLSDDGRGAAIYYQYPATGTNRLGVESNSIVSSPTGSFWFSGTNRDGKSNGNQVGVLKGPSAGYPLMLATESYFLQAEAALKGLIADDAEALFNDGIYASFNYTYQKEDNIDPSSTVVSTMVSDYQDANPSSYLVNFGLANTAAEKLEAIITQKFIALNFVHGHEAFNEYRRTHYPKIVATGNGYKTFASSVSESTRADKLPTRIMYPVSEGAYNSTNVPQDISPFNSLIFWAQ